MRYTLIIQIDMDNLTTFEVNMGNLESLYDAFSLDFAPERGEEDEDDSEDGYLEDEEEESPGDYNKDAGNTLLYGKFHAQKDDIDYNDIKAEGMRDLPDSDELESSIWEYLDSQGVIAEMDIQDQIAVEYSNNVIENFRETDPLSQSRYSADVLSIEYDGVGLINGQKTYQRIVFEADMDGESIYELTMRKMGEAGIEVSAEYDGEFDSMLLTSINNKYEGNDGNFNEFYLNGEIGANAANLESVKKGDIIEWRYAEETDGSCGGCPDFEKVRQLLEYSMASAKNQGYAPSVIPAMSGLRVPSNLYGPFHQMLVA